MSDSSLSASGPAAAAASFIIIDRNQLLTHQLAGIMEQVWSQQSTGFTGESWLSLINLGVRAVHREHPELLSEPRLISQAVTTALSMKFDEAGAFATSDKTGRLEFRAKLISDLDTWGLSLIGVLIDLIHAQQDAVTAGAAETESDTKRGGPREDLGHATDSASVHFRMALLAHLNSECPVHESGWLEAEWPLLVAHVIAFLQTLLRHDGDSAGTGPALLSARAKSSSALPGTIHSVSGGGGGGSGSFLSVGRSEDKTPSWLSMSAAGTPRTLGISSSAVQAIQKMSKSRKRHEAIACLRLVLAPALVSFDKVMDLVDLILASASAALVGAASRNPKRATGQRSDDALMLGALVSMDPTADSIAGASASAGAATAAAAGGGRAPLARAAQAASTTQVSRSTTGPPPPPPLVVVVAGPAVAGSGSGGSTCCEIL